MLRRHVFIITQEQRGRQGQAEEGWERKVKEDRRGDS
jgi:hypothetical protein